MSYPHLTTLYAALLAFVYLILSVRVIARRLSKGVNLGDGSDPHMISLVRSHGNFAEYVPLILLLVGALEAGGTGPATLHSLLLPLLVARVAHPFGIAAPAGSVTQRVLRGGGTIVTLLVLVVAAVLLLVRGLAG